LGRIVDPSRLDADLHGLARAPDSGVARIHHANGRLVPLLSRRDEFITADIGSPAHDTRVTVDVCRQPSEDRFRDTCVHTRRIVAKMVVAWDPDGRHVTGYGGLVGVVGEGPEARHDEGRLGVDIACPGTAAFDIAATDSGCVGVDLADATAAIGVQDGIDDDWVVA
jgi:hypothetical protein